MNFISQAHEPARLLLLNTYLIPAADPNLLIAANDRLKRESQEGLRREVEFAAAHSDGAPIDIETLCHMGSLRHVLAHVVKTQQADLVVLAQGGVDDEEIADLVQRLDCPFLIVRPGEALMKDSFDCDTAQDQCHDKDQQDPG